MDQLDNSKQMGAGEQEKHKNHLYCIMEKNFEVVKSIKEKDEEIKNKILDE